LSKIRVREARDAGVIDLHDAKVLLTGATGGIGQALAVALAARGGEMVLTGRRTDMLEPLAKKLGSRAIPADLADRDTIKDLLEAAGEIDVLVANAALPATGLLADYSIGEIDRALDVNLRAPIVMAKLAGERMAARRRDREEPRRGGRGPAEPAADRPIRRRRPRPGSRRPTPRRRREDHRTTRKGPAPQALTNNRRTRGLLSTGLVSAVQEQIHPLPERDAIARYG
jgi:NAD(P)-dependent dehydrogenase (short-subunit alcohol dehydrogenase family)